MMYASKFGYVNPVKTGLEMELVVISAAVIGGTNVFGGSGTVLGVVLGCIFLGLINQAMPVVGISGFWQKAIYGIAILAGDGLYAEAFRLEAAFTKNIPDSDSAARIWLDPAGRIVIAHDTDTLTILFPTGQVPPDIARLMPDIAKDDD
jgi:hypothetical protein